MPLERISAEEVRVRPGAIQELAVRLTDDDENPVSKKSVTFTITPPGAVLFNGAQYAAVETDAHGIVSVRALINEVGRHTVHVKAPPGDRHHKVQFTAIGTSDTEVVPMDDGILVINGGGERPMRLPLWPIAAMVIAALVIGGALLLFDRDGDGKAQPPVVVRPGPSSTVDSTARAEAQAARAAVEARAAELRGELDSGLAANSAHDRGYSREYTRPTLRLALENARRIAEGRGDLTADGKPSICRRDPDLPACRE